MKYIIIFLGFLLLSNDDAHAEITLCEESTVIHKPRADVNHNPHYSSSFGLTKGSGHNQIDPAIKSQDDNFAGLPDPVLIPVTIDVLERYDIDLPDGVEAGTFLGMMEIYKDGRILYNGMDISGDIKDVCQKNSTNDSNEN